MICGKCGKEIEDNAVFCPYCGTVIKLKEKLEPEIKETELIGKTNKKFHISPGLLKEFIIPTLITSIIGICLGIAIFFVGENFRHYPLRNPFKKGVIPYNVLFIGNCEFMEKKLNDIDIPSSVLSIGQYAFYGNQFSGDWFRIPESVLSIGNHAFEKNQLTRIYIPNNVLFIGEYAFAHNNLKEVHFSDSISFIAEGAFMGNQLYMVGIPESVIKIRQYAFSNNNLRYVIIPDSVRYIMDGAFENNDIEEITIGSDVFLYPNSEHNVFDHGFDDFYRSNNRQAGRYWYYNDKWIYKP